MISQMPDLTVTPAAISGPRAYAEAGIGPADVDVAELYDGFSWLAMAWLEALGFCGHGESGPFIEGGQRIALDGEIPLNTNGGQLSAGRLHGYGYLHEAVVQLRGLGGERQVPDDPEVAVVANGGGPVAGAMLLTRLG
jgi:acetyl-CoA acetyltransferase